MYRSLDAEKIVQTARELSDRVLQRFPGSGLACVAGELVSVCEEARQASFWLARPRAMLRLTIAACLLVVLLAVLGTVMTVRVRMAFVSATEFVQALQAAIQNLVFLGIAIVFLLTLEGRWKRHRALKALHALRSMAHIIDMHQLTKDPERLANDVPSSSASGRRPLAPLDLIRYLDYCSDMLAVISKAAALYVQKFDDPVTLAAVNEIENLVSGLSRKIWQKIMILDRIASA